MGSFDAREAVIAGDRCTENELENEMSKQKDIKFLVKDLVGFDHTVFADSFEIADGTANLYQGTILIASFARYVYISRIN